MFWPGACSKREPVTQFHRIMPGVCHAVALALAAALVSFAGGCGSSQSPADAVPSDSAANTPPADSGADAVPGDVDASANVSVEIGLPSGDDGLAFAPLEPLGELRLESFGQGGIHVLLAIRCVGFGNRAFVTITVTNPLTGAQVVSPAPVRPQLLLCRDAEVCDLVPVLVMVGAIAPPDTERNGLHVRITADVHNSAGAASSASQEAVLSTADL